jgi:hypothetical protein
LRIIADPGGSDHPAVADQHQALDAEARLQLVDPGPQRRRIRGVASNTSTAIGNPSRVQSRP